MMLFLDMHLRTLKNFRFSFLWNVKFKKKHALLLLFKGMFLFLVIRSVYSNVCQVGTVLPQKLHSIFVQ